MRRSLAALDLGAEPHAGAADAALDDFVEPRKAPAHKETAALEG